MKLMKMLLNNNRGVVLLLVLSAVALFTVLVVNFSAEQNLDIELSYNYRDSVQAQYIARSGIEAAMSVLKIDDQAYDAEDEDWGEFAEYALVASGYLEGPAFTGTLTDESGKFDLNSLLISQDQAQFRVKKKEQFVRLFTLLEIDITEAEAGELADAVKDWLDEDDETETDSENDYYQSLDHPYECKNARMDSPEEILLVKGMKPEYYYGTEHYEGIKNFITAGPGGKININTATDKVLMSISDSINEEVAESIKDCRPFKTENYDCILGLNFSDTSDDISWIKNAIGIKSSRFCADMKGSMTSGAQVNVKALLERKDDTVRIVYYKIY